MFQAFWLAVINRCSKKEPTDLMTMIRKVNAHNDYTWRREQDARRIIADCKCSENPNLVKEMESMRKENTDLLQRLEKYERSESDPEEDQE